MQQATRSYVSFDDPDGDRWIFDVSFLTSNWTCIYGNGCQGIVGDPELGALQGCCSHGVHLLDDDDQHRVAHAASRLEARHWQSIDLVSRDDDLFQVDEDGDTLTAVHEGACIFLNGPDAPTGAGCALHYASVEAGEPPHTWKPVACWQLPLRIEKMNDSSERTTWMVRSWDQEDWGAGGATFDWWCTSDPHAYIGAVPVYEAMREELVELIGEEPWEWFRAYVADGATAVTLP